MIERDGGGDVTETNDSTSTLDRTGNDVTGDYDSVETSGYSRSLHEEDVNQTQTATIDETGSGSSTVTTSGNDITSSCLYVSALAIVYAGKLAPISLLMVAAVLFLFRKIYAEVVGALPLNGGAYNALLNTTSKRAAVWQAGRDWHRQGPAGTPCG